VPFTIPASVSAGTYELRVFSNNTYARLATSGPINVQSATLSANPSTVPGGTVTASWSGIAQPSSTDWIALYSTGAPDHSWISWRFTDGAAVSSVPFTIPASVSAGTYELRLFSNNTYVRLAISGPIAVLP
jgi:hypothetical protein